jgi:ABC-type nitrate/sulfonate/bicarbonate transport system substrate-binding protein
MARARTGCLVLAWVMLIGLAATTSAPAQTRLTIMVFQGMQNLPILAAQSKGFFAKRGIELDIKLAPNSDEMRNGLAAGRYQLVHSGIDNSVHLVENQKVDSVIFMGGDHGFNYLLVQPQINSYEDIRGKTVGVDAVNTAYAFLLYAMLKQQGLNRGDYTPKSIGSSARRLQALKEDRSIVASMLNPPFSLLAMRDAGMKNWGWAVKALGPYQATGGYVLRSWAAANADTMVRYIQAYVEGLRYALDPKNRDEAIKLLIDNIKLPPDIAAQAYDMEAHPTEGLAKDARFDLEGFRNVLRLRAEAEGGTLGAPEKYFDLSYYQKALAGL